MLLVWPLLSPVFRTEKRIAARPKNGTEEDNTHTSLTKVLWLS